MKFKETSSFQEVDISAEPRVTTSKWDEVDETEGTSNAADDEDIDGVPLDEDEPMDQGQEANSSLTLSETGGGKQKSASPVRSQEYEEKRRQLLREIEVSKRRIFMEDEGFR